MKIEIKHWLTAKLLFSADADNLKLAVELAVKQGADLTGADLKGANLKDADLKCVYLKGADLTGADLTDANLTGCKLDGGELIDDNERPVFTLGPIGTDQRTLFAFSTEKGIRLKTGCFFGSKEDFLAKLKTTHGDNNHAREYQVALDMIEAHFGLWRGTK